MRVATSPGGTIEKMRRPMRLGHNTGAEKCLGTIAAGRVALNGPMRTRRIGTLACLSCWATLAIHNHAILLSASSEGAPSAAAHRPPQATREFAEVTPAHVSQQSGAKPPGPQKQGERGLCDTPEGDLHDRVAPGACGRVKPKWLRHDLGGNTVVWAIMAPASHASGGSLAMTAKRRCLGYSRGGRCRIEPFGKSCAPTHAPAIVPNKTNIEASFSALLDVAFLGLDCERCSLMAHVGSYTVVSWEGAPRCGRMFCPFLGASSTPVPIAASLPYCVAVAPKVAD